MGRLVKLAGLLVVIAVVVAVLKQKMRRPASPAETFDVGATVTPFAERATVRPAGDEGADVEVAPPMVVAPEVPAKASEEPGPTTPPSKPSPAAKSTTAATAKARKAVPATPKARTAAPRKAAPATKATAKKATAKRATPKAPGGAGPAHPAHPGEGD